MQSIIDRRLECLTLLATGTRERFPEAINSCGCEGVLSTWILISGPVEKSVGESTDESSLFRFHNADSFHKY